ncbi:putative expansin-B2 [Sesamum indicum]|uniref:Expansin-B2 n=1 Tax=Sesamum indicum TaxID=4182 RepID=A0A6I9TG63_SESIN|nr:putative expansin-B2 [Sesamum indicum]
MFARVFQPLTLSIVAVVLLLQTNNCVSTYPSTFSDAVATWYGSPTGYGSGGGCGFENDVGNAPYNGMIAAGNNNIFKSGKGCGACYQVKCTDHSLCSGSPITITITDECPGACNNEAFHFDLSGKAFGSLAKPGHADALRKAGKVNIKYKRVQCNYNGGMTFKIDAGSNPNYLAFAIEHVHGDGDIAAVEILASNSKEWMAMQPSWGATWKVGLPVEVKGPFSVRVTTIQSGRKVVAHQAIPANWSPGQHYLSHTK